MTSPLIHVPCNTVAKDQTYRNCPDLPPKRKSSHIIRTALGTLSNVAIDQINQIASNIRWLVSTKKTKKSSKECYEKLVKEVASRTFDTNSIELIEEDELKLEFYLNFLACESVENAIKKLKSLSFSTREYFIDALKDTFLLHSESMLQRLLEFELDREENIDFIYFVIANKLEYAGAYISNFQFSPFMLYRIAHRIAITPDNALGCYIEEFKFTDQQQLKYLAIQVARNSPENIAKTIHNFKIESELTRKAIAMLIAEKTPFLCEYFDQFQFSDHRTRKQLAAKCEKFPETLAKNIKKFELHDEEFRGEIAIRIAYSESVLEYISDFKLNPRDTIRFFSKLPENIANKWVSLFPNLVPINQDTLELISRYSDDNSHLLHCLQFFSPQNSERLIRFGKNRVLAGKHIAEIVHYFHIEDEEQRYELALFEATYYPFRLAEFIQNYQLGNNKFSLTIIYTLLNKNNGVLNNQIALHFKKFNIQDPKEHEKIALRLLNKRDLENLLNSLENIEIESNELLEKIFEYSLKFCSKQNRYESLLNNYYKFKRTDHSHIIKLIKELAKRIEISKYISKLNITDTNALLKIAKLACKHGDVTFFEHFPHYKITDEIAIFCLIRIHTNLSQLANWYEHFFEEDEKDRTSCISLIQSRKIFSISPYIHKFKITSEEVRYRIACIELNNGFGEVLCNNLKNYQIENENLLSDLFKRIINGRRSLNHISSNVNKLNLPLKLREEIVEQLVKVEPRSLTNIDNFNIESRSLALIICHRFIEFKDIFIIGTYLTFKLLNLLSENKRFELLYNNIELISVFEKFNIKNKEYLKKIALRAMLETPDSAIMRIKDFRIRDMNLRKKLFKIASTRSFSKLIDYFIAFALPDAILIENHILSFLKRDYSGLKFMLYINNQKLRNQLFNWFICDYYVCLYERILVCEVSTESICNKLNEFSLEKNNSVVRDVAYLEICDQKLLIELATNSLMNDKYCCEHFHLFGINEESVRYKLAKKLILSSKSKRIINQVKNLQNFEVINPKYYEKLILLAISKSPKSVLKTEAFKRFNERQKYKFILMAIDCYKKKMAYKQTQKSVILYFSLSDKIKEFEFTNPEFLTHLAEIAAELDPQFIKYHHVYHIHDHNLLYKLVKTSSVRFPDSITTLTNILCKFNPTQIYELGRQLAATSSEFFKVWDFSYCTHDTRMEFIEIAAKFQGFSTFTGLIRLNIIPKDRETKKKLARYCIESTNKENLFGDFNKWNFNKKDKIELCLYAAKFQPKLLFDCTSFLVTLKPSVCEKILLMLVETIPKTVSYYSHRLKDFSSVLTTLLPIAKKAMSVDPDLFLEKETFKQFNIQDDKQLDELFEIALKKSKTLYRHIKRFGKTPSDRYRYFIRAAPNSIECLDLYSKLIKNDNSISSQLHNILYNIKNPVLEIIPLIEKYLDSKSLTDVFKDILKVTLTESDAFIQKNQVRWIVYTLILFKSYQINSNSNVFAYIKNEAVLNEIFFLRDPLFKSILVSKIFSILTTLPKIPDNTSKYKLINVLIAKLLEDNSNVPFSLINAIQELSKELKDGQLHLLILKFLYFLESNTLLTNSEKITTLEHVLSLPDKRKNRLNTIPLLESINGIMFLKKYYEENRENAIEDAFTEAFQKTIPIHNVDNLAVRLNETFIMKLRNQKNALYEYAAVLSSEKEKTLFLNLLAKYVEVVLTGTFKSFRMNLENSIHLKTVFSEYPQLVEKWAPAECVAIPFTNLQAQLSPETLSAEKKWDFKQFIKQKIFQDKHLTFECIYINKETDTTCWAILIKHIKANQTNQSKLKRQLAAMNRDKNNGKEVSSDKENAIAKQLKEAMDLYTKLIFEKQCLLILKEENHYHIQTMINKLGELFKLAKKLKEDEFCNDLQAEIDNLKQTASENGVNNISRYLVKDSDDPIDLLLCGTEVAGSCQRVSGNSTSNKCLIAYLLDGKIRLIAIVDENGKIIARSIFRILWNKTLSLPVLALERVYPTATSLINQGVIVEMAKLRAKELELTLVSKEVGTGPAYEHTVYSLGGIAPYEYVDSGYGKHKNSCFELKELHILYQNED